MNELKVGILALVTMGTIVIMSLKVTSNQSGFGDYVPYKTIVSDASGIFPKTPIKVAGINAGRIKNIQLAGNNKAIIEFEILEKIKITSDSKLSIKSVGFLGDKYLEIKIGVSDEVLTHNSVLVASEGSGMNGLVSGASEIMDDVKVVMKSLRETLAPEGQEAPLKKIMKDVEILAENTRVATEAMKNIMAGNEEKITAMIENMEAFSRDLAYQVNNQNRDSAMSDVKEILANAKRMTSDMEKLVAHVKAGKGTMGQFLVKDDIADEVQQTLSGVSKLVGRVDQIRTELSVFTGANSDYGSESELALRIFPSPERFYLLGVNTTEYGPNIERVTETTSSNGVTTTEVNKTKTRGDYRFNVQIGRRIHNWTLRGGLIETTGGLGVDYHFSSWDTRLTAEIFDYREELGPNIRFATDFQIYNVFYGKLAFEDVINDTRSATLSAGLKFNDEDLKGLIAFFIRQ
jgi:phospholipid/cholesterol/gamma-HCH transport system substrate-binding protein